MQDSPVEPGSYVIEGPAAKAFRAVAVAHLDLRIAREMIGECLADDDDEGESSGLRHEAFWTTALVRYNRAFDSGSGGRWDSASALSVLPAACQALSARLRMLRDKMVAHPVGLGEDMAVTAVLGPAIDSPCRVYGGAVRKSRVTSLGTDEAARFADLLDRLIPVVADMEAQQHRAFLAEISEWPQQRLTAGGLYRGQVHLDDSSVLYRQASKQAAAKSSRSKAKG